MDPDDDSVDLFDQTRNNVFDEMYCVAPGILPHQVDDYWNRYLRSQGHPIILENDIIPICWPHITDPRNKSQYKGEDNPLTWAVRDFLKNWCIPVKVFPAHEIIQIGFQELKTGGTFDDWIGDVLGGYEPLVPCKAVIYKQYDDECDYDDDDDWEQDESLWIGIKDAYHNWKP